MGCLRPVQAEHSGVGKEGRGQINDDFPIDSLLEDLPEEVRLDDRVQLRESLLENRDIFLIAERELGRTTVTMNKIDTVDARPYDKSTTLKTTAIAA